MKKFFIITALVLAVFQAKAIRFVGNGGGDAELNMISYFRTLPVWLDYCSSSGTDCVQNVDAAVWMSFSLNLKKLQISEIEFISEKDFNNSYLVKSANGVKLRITFESLYINNKTSRPAAELFSILLNQIFKATNDQTVIAANAVLAVPIVKKHPNLEIYALSLQGKHRLYSPNVDLNSKLKNRSELSDVRIRSETATGYIIDSFNMNTAYELYVAQTYASGYQVILYVQFTED